MEMQPQLRAGGTVSIGLAEEDISVGAGANLFLEQTPKYRPNDWDFRWERNGVAVTDVSGSISGSTTDKLRIHSVSLDDAGIYRCQIKAKDGYETVYTLEVCVQVQGAAYKQRLSTTTPVSGALKTTTTPATACVNPVKGYVRYKCAQNPAPSTTCRSDSIWWCFPSTTREVTITKTAPSADMKIEVIDSYTGAPVKACEMNTTTFPNDPSRKYQILIYSTTDLPAGTVIKANVVW